MKIAQNLHIIALDSRAMRPTSIHHSHGRGISSGRRNAPKNIL